MPVRLTVVGALQNWNTPPAVELGFRADGFQFDSHSMMLTAWSTVTVGILEHPFDVGADVLFALFGGVAGLAGGHGAVSYTHLTLPTIYSV